jgi:hypothetical protein
LALIELESGHASAAEAGYVSAATGQTAEAEKLLAALKDLGRQGETEPAYILLLELGLGLRDQALETLKEFSGSKFSGTHAFGQWHGFDVLNTDPQYRKLMAELP